MDKKLKLVIAVVTVAVVGTLILVGTALAQPPTPNDPTPPTREQITTWMQGMMERVHGPGSFDQMTQWMDQVHGPGSFDRMADAMSQGGFCGGGTSQDDQTGGTTSRGPGGMMGGRGDGMMGGYY